MLSPTKKERKAHGWGSPLSKTSLATLENQGHVGKKQACNALKVHAHGHDIPVLLTDRHILPSLALSSYLLTNSGAGLGQDSVPVVSVQEQGKQEPKSNPGGVRRFGQDKQP